MYARYINGGKPAPDEYRALQNYLFRYVAREVGRIGLVVHVHTDFGEGRYFDVNGSNPLLLEPVFNDPSLKNTRSSSFTADGHLPSIPQPCFSNQTCTPISQP